MVIRLTGNKTRKLQECIDLMNPEGQPPEGQQPYILVSKLKKIKTKFLRCTGYLNSIKNPIKQDLLQILVLVRQQNFLNC